MEGEPVGSAAVAARLAPVRIAARPRAATGDLAFDRLGGPVVAICGLAGGVGSSTLALALARQAAADSRTPVLLADAAGTAGLASMAGARSPQSLGAIARALADGDQPKETFIEFPSGLRLIATDPERPTTVETAAVHGLLAQAKEAHGLVVIDCGTAWMANDAALGCASCVVWAMTATASGLSAAQRIVASGLMPHRGAGETLVARHVPGTPGARVRVLRGLARERHSRLVLIAHDERGGLQDPPGEPMLRALAGVAPTLRKGRP